MLLNETRIKLIVADDHPAIRRGLKDLFANRKEIVLLGVVSNGREVLELMQTDCPHVILSDIKMPVVDGRELCKVVRHQYPKVSVVAYSMFDDCDAITDMRKAGACGHVLKISDEDEIIKAIKTAYEGGEYYCTAIKQRITSLYITGCLGAASIEKKQGFSGTELQIIKLVCQEQSSKEIGDSLGLSKRTVEHHQEKIPEKMDVQGVVGMAIYAIKNWLLYSIAILLDV